MALQYQLAGSATASPVAPALFDLSRVLGNVALGLDTTGNFALTLSGTALARPDGTYVRLGSREELLIDVTPLILPGIDPMVMRLPVRPRAVTRGDIVIVSDTPFQALFVLDVGHGGRIVALDPIQEQLVTHVPARNLFFNVVVRATSLLDLVSHRRRAAGPERPDKPDRSDRPRGRGDEPARRRASESPRPEENRRSGGSGEPS